MEYVRLGSTGMKVSRLCLGMMSYGDPKWRDWVLDEAASRPFIRRALEQGINFFDTANVYSLGMSEEVTGRALKEMARREEVVIATKVWNAMGSGPNDRGLSRKHILASIDASLRRLETDYVDLYQIHRWDYHTPIEETLEALNDVVRAGKARYIGASTCWAWQFAKALYLSEKHGWARFVTMQNQLNLVYREEEREMVPLCVAEGIGLIPWSPLARGFLSGNRGRQGKDETTRAKSDEMAHELYYTDADFEIVTRLGEIAAARGLTSSQVALAWVMQHAGVSAPIVGATKMHHLDEALGALSVKLDPEEIKRIEEPYRPKATLDHR